MLPISLENFNRTAYTIPDRHISEYSHLSNCIFIWYHWAHLLLRISRLEHTMVKRIVFLIIVCAMIGFAQDTIQPAPTYKPAPAYPENAKKLRVEAQIFLSVLISKTGGVLEAELAQGVVKYPGGRVLLESKNDLNKIPPSHRNSAAKLLEVAQQTARLWKFTPATINGKSEEAMIVLPFTFKLNTGPASGVAPQFQLKK
jgi:hypothetical protein